MKRTLEQNAVNFSRYSAVMSNAHYDMAELYRRRHRKFGLIVVIATSMVGAAALGSLAKLVEPPADLWVKLAIGLLSIFATVLSALQTFLGFSDLQTQHKRAGDGYSIARRDLDLLMMKFPDATGFFGEPATKEFEAVKKMLDDLDKASPTIPDDVYEAAVKKTPTNNAS